MVDSQFETVFISGAPRSGTTVAHALICTLPSVNMYIGECSYFSELVRAYIRGLETYDIHTRFYFEDKADFANQHRALLDSILTSHWKRFGKPTTLALKDPDMLPIVPTVAELVTRSKFVIVLRDPRDVIASRVRVQQRRAPQRDFVNEENITSLAEEYNAGYHAVKRLMAAEPRRVFLLEYEQIVKNKLGRLEKFLNAGSLDPSSVWNGSAVAPSHVADDPWYSKSYFKPIDDNAVGSYQQTLDGRTIELVESFCGPISNDLRSLAALDGAEARDGRL